MKSAPDAARGTRMGIAGWILMSALAGVTPAVAEAEVATAASEAAPENPYRIIPTRNAFGIRPPAPPAPPPAPPAPPKPPSNLFLTGISRWQGVKTVYLQVNRQGSTPEFLELGEGEAQDDLKVISIDEKTESVRVVHQGQEMALNFKENGLKAAAAPTPAPGRGGAPGRPAPGAPPAATPNPVPAPVPAAAAGPKVIGRGGGINQAAADPGAFSPVATGFNPAQPVVTDLRSAPVQGGAGAVPIPNLQNRVRNVPPPPPLPIDPGLLQVVPE